MVIALQVFPSAAFVNPAGTASRRFAGRQVRVLPAGVRIEVNEMAGSAQPDLQIVFERIAG
ncbi:hypothetical protein [Mycolicibacterium porcinum]|uniref:Uncharacterized protein n=1 Tax=Mycolicibacterium porcinum TaxID=39693 RepID=A0AAW5T3R2_9MYCO|nr:hypothetical protein [Mycolicibacterium porcinum]MCV7389322.1 hypothetical protein [Mycolicibacterium porcinum]